jgi:hypothetical protein
VPVVDSAKMSAGLARSFSMAIGNIIESVLIASDIAAYTKQQKCPDERDGILRMGISGFERFSGPTKL